MHASHSPLNSPGGNYRGDWRIDSDTGKVAGNPAASLEVQQIMKCITNKTRASGSRDHAEAMRIEDLRKIMQWSETQVTSTIDWCNTKITDTSRLLTIAKHLSTRAFMTMAFTLWTR